MTDGDPLPYPSATDIAAWVGAVGALAALTWDIYKWKSAGPNLKVHVAQNMSGPPGTALEIHGLVAIFSVTNVGSAATTITHVVMHAYLSRWHRIRRRQARVAALFPMIWLDQSLPYVLPPGEQWKAAFPQKKLFEGLDKKEQVLLGVHHALAEQPTLVRVEQQG